jgi:hypothetical protein
VWGGGAASKCEVCCGPAPAAVGAAPAPRDASHAHGTHHERQVADARRGREQLPGVGLVLLRRLLLLLLALAGAALAGQVRQHVRVQERLHTAHHGRHGDHRRCQDLRAARRHTCVSVRTRSAAISRPTPPRGAPVHTAPRCTVAGVLGAAHVPAHAHLQGQHLVVLGEGEAHKAREGARRDQAHVGQDAQLGVDVLGLGHVAEVVGRGPAVCPRGRPQLCAGPRVQCMHMCTTSEVHARQHSHAPEAQADGHGAPQLSRNEKGGVHPVGGDAHKARQALRLRGVGAVGLVAAAGSE